MEWLVILGLVAKFLCLLFLEGVLLGILGLAFIAGVVHEQSITMSRRNYEWYQRYKWTCLALAFCTGTCMLWYLLNESWPH